MKFRHIRLLAYIGILSLTLSSWVSFSPYENCSSMLHNNDSNIFMIETSTCKEMIRKAGEFRDNPANQIYKSENYQRGFRIGRSFKGFLFGSGQS